MEHQIERNFQGLDVIGYLAGICLAQNAKEARDDIIAEFYLQTEGASNA